MEEDPEERFQQIAEVPGFVKDKKTGAILNTNVSALEAYNIQKERMLKQNQNETRLDKLEDDIAEIKGLLKELIGIK